MMEQTPFIQVILPLKLEWEPYYTLPQAAVGERVNVVFSGRQYVGVVSAVGVTPTPGIHILEAQKTGLPPVDPSEIAFWRSIAAYYLCSVGEVYKSAYPMVLLESMEVRIHDRLEKRLCKLRNMEERARKDATRARYKADADRVEAILQGKAPSYDPTPCILPQELQTAKQQIDAAFEAQKTVLIHGSERTPLYLELARETLNTGRSVLYLVPEIALTKQLEEEVAAVFEDLQLYHSGLTIAQKRGVTAAVRSGEPSIVLGTRSALFLPYLNLGLVIVDQEQDSTYKQAAPAPRYHVREAAILLAKTQHAQVVLGSETPSLESIYNTSTGLFISVQLKQRFSNEDASRLLLISMGAEHKKKGMVGLFSLKLLAPMKECLEAGEKVLCVCRSKQAIPECREQLESIFPEEALERIVLATPASVKTLNPGAYALTAILQADGLFGKEDFRCDERALQLFQQLLGRSEGLLAVQTCEMGHPVFKALKEGLDASVLLPERQAFGYPPYTRLIDVIVRDVNEKRLYKMASELARTLKQAIPGPVIMGPYAPAGPAGDQCRNIRLILPRDKTIHTHKQALATSIFTLEKERKYIGHIAIDVDPV